MAGSRFQNKGAKKVKQTNKKKNEKKTEIFGSVLKFQQEFRASQNASLPTATRVSVTRKRRVQKQLC